MVQVKESQPSLEKGEIDIDQWVSYLCGKGYYEDEQQIRNACLLSQLAGHDQATETGVSCLQQGLAIADVLSDLEVDLETLLAGIIFETVYYAELSADNVEEQLGAGIARLVSGVERMSALQNFEALNKYPQNKHQLDNVRKMLLAMVDDVRVVLIKLAERLCILRFAAPIPASLQRQVAQEAMDIYAPLANRLGIGAIKWEMEDLAFRYLEPEKYKEIAKGLNARRIERDKFVDSIVQTLNQKIQALGITHYAVYGRSKHIHSIYRKMLRKQVPLNEIYDATAVRVMVDTKDQCYEVLSLVHSLWPQITAEFDDYIINTKPNGYQSLHTAVEGPEKRAFEVQIRTYHMHESAEMGVAAHWKYKEGGARHVTSHERKIEWLRDVLAWHKEMATSKGISSQIENEFIEDRVYVFTPGGDVVDLQTGSTPLDFAYHIHSQVGHRCRGAKVNGHIVPLTYELKTGDAVEVLTGKEPKPSRDWVNPHLNYLKTSRAKAKVTHWFKMQDFDRNKEDGHAILDKDLKALGIKTERLTSLLSVFNLKTVDDLFAAIGRGDLKSSQIINRLTPDDAVMEAQEEPKIIKSKAIPKTSGSDLVIEGVGNLLTYMARCCKPLPGDDVVGYITLGRGVSIHLKDCPNIIHSSEKQKQRFLDVSWVQKTHDQYVVDIGVKAFDRAGLLRDITSTLSNEKAHVYALKTDVNKNENRADIHLTVEVDGINSLVRLLTKLQQIPNVIEAKRLVH